MAISSLFAALSPSYHSLSQPQLHLSPSPFNGPSNLIRFPSSKLSAPLCSSSTSTPVVEDGLPPPAQSDPPIETSDDVPFRGCKACGREEIERGCNGEGRIQGGIATVPGFGWWPIKAYRPCPGFIASGGRYFRRGQSMDEVASGRGGPAATYADSDDESEPSKKTRDPRRFKR
ncbi:uncharacterized protein LOC116192153 isoform X1 [Punica granatum]|uniref:Uncharacterized protein LOC116192153 isoform X1 n=1 Tax=Punica granatum TaxID=22663 RepID=A0A6P8C1I4_PUNGR|nr:uncharacterized protein LOC116192153 isoform X1 [Punica granatum]